MRYFATILLLLASYSGRVAAQPIDWKSTGSFLPKGNYYLHISWEQQLYISNANSGLIYKHLSHISNWTPVVTQPSTYITIISDSLALGLDNTFGNYSIMFRIRNGWKTQDTIVADQFGQFGKMHVADDTTIYYTKGGSLIFRSTDVGATWDTLLLGESIRGLRTDKQNALYAQGERNIYRSADGGHSWDTLYDGSTFDPPLSFILKGDDVYVVTITGNFLKNSEFVSVLPQNGYLHLDGAGYLYLSTSGH